MQTCHQTRLLTVFSLCVNEALSFTGIGFEDATPVEYDLLTPAKSYSSLIPVTPSILIPEIMEPVPVYVIHYNEAFNGPCVAFLQSIEHFYPAVIAAINNVSDLPHENDNLVPFISFLAGHNVDALPALDNVLSAIADPVIRQSFFLKLIASYGSPSLLGFITFVDKNTPFVLPQVITLLTSSNDQDVQQAYLSAFCSLPTETLPEIIKFFEGLDDFQRARLNQLISEAGDFKKRRSLLISIIRFVTDNKSRQLSLLLSWSDLENDQLRQHIIKLLIYGEKTFDDKRMQMRALITKIIKNRDKMPFIASDFRIFFLMTLRIGRIPSDQINPIEGERYQTASSYLMSWFQQTLSLQSLDTDLAMPLADLLLSLMVDNHPFLFYLTGSDPQTFLPNNSNPLIQMLHTSVNQGFVTHEQAGHLLFLFWQTPAVVDFFTSIDDYLQKSQTESNMEILGSHLQWFIRNGGSALNEAIKALPRGLNFVFFRTLAHMPYTHPGGKFAVTDPTPEDTAVLLDSPEAVRLLMTHQTLFQYLPLPELARNLKLLLTTLKYTSNREKDLEQRTDDLHQLLRFSHYKMKPLVKGAYEMGQLEPFVPLAVADTGSDSDTDTDSDTDSDTDTNTEAAPKAKVWVISQYNWLLGWLEHISIQPAINGEILTPELLTVELLGLGLHMDIPESAEQATDNIIKWLIAGFRVYVIKKTDTAFRLVGFVPGEGSKVYIQQDDFEGESNLETLPSQLRRIKVETGILVGAPPTLKMELPPGFFDLKKNVLKLYE